jgi:hypothetical protein
VFLKQLERVNETHIKGREEAGREISPYTRLHSKNAEIGNFLFLKF